MTHIHPIRVYYEDTDLAGIVYYANYLKFTERARSELLRAHEVDQAALKADQGLVFAVRDVQAEYLIPAVFDDLVDVRTDVLKASGARLQLRQDVWRGEDRLFGSTITLVCLDAQGRVARLPADIRRLAEGAAS